MCRRRKSRFSSAQAIAGSMRLATQPASVRPRARTASTVSSAWFRQPRRRPTTSTTGTPRACARSAPVSSGAPGAGSPSPSSSGTRKPPAPSTITRSAWAHSARCAATSGASVMRWPARRAARCGDSGSGRQNGLTSAGSAATLPAACSVSTSPQASEPSGCGSIPAATGFMPTARSPACAAPRSSAALTSDLPTPVSVPITKTERRSD